MGMDDRESLALKHRLDQPPMRRIVIDDQNCLRHKPITFTKPLIIDGGPFGDRSSPIRVKGRFKAMKIAEEIYP
jgi:hypothetical protein